MDSPSQAAPMAQTEYSTTDGNLDGNTQGEKLHWLPIPIFSLRNKIKNKK
jgi:hypothetical protein